MKKIGYIILLVLVFISCKKTLDIYLGIPLQPKFDEDNFVPGLNIFGVLRTDSTLSYNNSFVLLQRVIRAVGGTGGLEIDTAIVNLTWLDGATPKNNCSFILSNKDSVFKEVNFRPECKLNPKSGELYQLECIHHHLSTIYGRTIIPNKPFINQSSVEFSDSQLRFELVQDTTYFMVDVYTYHQSNISGYARIPNNEGVARVVSINNLQSKPDSVVMYTYDYNLSVYYLTSNTSLNLNKYRASFSTIENGYGVFGSMNSNSDYLETLD